MVSPRADFRGQKEEREGEDGAGSEPDVWHWGRVVDDDESASSINKCSFVRSALAFLMSRLLPDKPIQMTEQPLQFVFRILEPVG